MRTSIIIRNYNYEEYVAEAVDSALDQRHPYVEVIVVDDGSTDRSRSILRSYGDRIDLVMQENGGEGSACNAGFARARGDIVIFLDSDDVLAPDCVARAVAEMKPGVTRVHWWMYMIDAGGCLTGHIQPPAPVPRLSFEESMRRYGCMIGIGQSYNAFRRDVLEQVFPINPEGWMRAPDVLLEAVCAAAGPTAFIDAPLGGYRVHDRNLSLLNALDVTKNHYALRIIPQLHADLIALLGAERAKDIGLSLPLGHWRNRLASYRLSPETHPYPRDQRSQLVANILERIRTRVWTSRARQAVLIAGTFGLAYIPRPILRRLYPWFARIARDVGLFRGGRRTFRRHAPTKVRPGMHWRHAFQPASLCRGRPVMPDGRGTPQSKRSVGAISSTEP